MTAIIKKIALLFPIIAGTCWECSGVFVRFLDGTGFDNITNTFVPSEQFS